MTTFRADHYYRYEELTNLLNEFQTQFPELTKLESIGKTIEGRVIWLMTLTNSNTGLHSEKPAVWIDANTHAGEVAGTQVALYTIQKLLSGYGTDPEMTSLLDRLTFYIVPRISADGAEYYLTTPYAVRSTTKMWPNEDLIEAHYPKDINNDGRVLMMRKEDPAGAFKISKKNPQLMIQRTHEDWPSNSEKYYQLYTEGEFNQFDGFTKNFSRPYGLDLNRQFSSGFRPEGEQPGAGPYAHFLPEAQALVKAITDRPNISVALTYHTYGGMVLRLPTLHSDEKMNPKDLLVYKKLCESMAQKTSYKLYNVFKDFKNDPSDITTGSFDEWLYGHRGILAATIEIWDIGSEAGMPFSHSQDCYNSPSEGHLVAIYNWCAMNLPAGSFHSDWKRFEHPQLGPVEIGGWDWKFIFQNPPTIVLEKECKKVFLGSISFAKACPLPKIETVVTTKLGNSHTKIEVVIKNDGFLPTHGSEQALSVGAARKPRVYANLSKNLKLNSGKTEFDIDHLSGRSVRGHRHSPVWNAEIGNCNERKLEWIVEGSGKLQIKIKLERGGTLQTTVEI